MNSFLKRCDSVVSSFERKRRTSTPIVKKTTSLTLVIAICLWIAVRDFVPFTGGVEEDFDRVAAVFNLGTDGAIESLRRTIDRQKADGVPAERLAETYRLRGSYKLQKHEPSEALADFDEALRLNAGETVARFGRAECLRQLGHPDQANAEIQKTDLLDLSDAFPELKRTVAWTEGLFAVFTTPKAAWLVVAAAWVFLTLTNVAVGRAQTAEASGSVVRLLWVAGALAVLEALPLGVWATLAACEGTAQVNGWFAGGVTGLCILATIPVLTPPITLRAKGVNLPRVDDREFLKRVAELAHQMHVPVPVVRLWRSITGSQQALAFAGTLQAPQLVVTDGILTRLAPLERDAVVAHELGHIVNGSLWLLAAVIPVSCAAATAISAWLGPSLAVPFGLAMGMGLRRIVSRPLERDADCRAARAIGFRETIAALTKIHAVHPLGNSGLMPLLVYATATHPSPEMRLSWLRAKAPAGDVSGKGSCPRTIRLHRIAAAVAFVVWLLVLAGTLAARIWAPHLTFLAAPLWAVALTPAVLVRLAHWRHVSVAKRRMGHSRVRTVVVVIALLVCPILGTFPEQAKFLLTPLGWFNDSEQFLLFPLLLAVICLPFACWSKRVQETRKLRREVMVALQLHDFRRVLEIGRSAPKIVARDSLLRYHIAFARAVDGDCPAAIAELDRLWHEHPGLPVTALTLSALLLDADLAEQALAVAHSVARRLPDDAATHLLVARSLRRLGRLKESSEACNRALAVEPRSGTAHAIAAALALDEGDFFQAQQAIATGLELSPGEPYVLLCRAEIVLKTQPFANPRAAMEEALAVIRANPFAFYHADVERLGQMLTEWECRFAVLEAAAAGGAPAAV
jgi:Zn-dependent protease with chaperone function